MKTFNEPSITDQMNDLFNEGTIVTESIIPEVTLDHTLGVTPTDTQPFVEAVFAGGKQTVMPLVNKIQQIKDLLDEQINQQNASYKDAKEVRKSNKKGEQKKQAPKIKVFDPVAFWRHQLFKELEDSIGSIFGFRNVEIHPYVEKYNSSSKEFESKILNCEIYHSDRFPIEGLVTDKGFYDKSKSLTMQIHVSLGLLKELSAEEVLAVLLHEFGHSIDPALVDIKYTEVNILSKYLTDRKNAINKSEEKVIKQNKVAAEGILVVTWILLIFAALFGSTIGKFVNFLMDKFGNKEKAMQKRLKKVKAMVDSDKSKFNRQNYSEAYADNFARMYGFGAQLASGLRKLSSSLEKNMKSRYKRETERQMAIVYITSLMIKDVHKTDLHRIRNLIKEYKADIDDPNTSPTVKKQLKEDLVELEKVLDEYLNNFSEFQNRVNRIINEELEKVEIAEERNVSKKEKESSEDKEEKEDKKAAIVKEGFEYFDESSKAYEKLEEAKKSLSSSERAEVKEKFGQSKQCSFAKDKDGYYCFTHRCRSKSYESIDKIPQKDVDFVRSTC